MVGDKIKRWAKTITANQKAGKTIHYVCRCGRLYDNKVKEADHDCEYLAFTTEQDALCASIMITDAVWAYEKATKKKYYPPMYNKKVVKPRVKQK
jgi:hypothetical protein